MSAVSSNSSDRDRELEALRRAQRAYEPSMEEILASIRNIIADDREAGRPPEAKGAAQRAAPANAPGPQIVYSKGAPEPPLDEAPATEPNAPKVIWSHPDPAKSEAAKSEAAKSEAGKSEAGKSEAGKPDAGKSDAGKQDPARSEAAKREAAKSGVQKQEPVKAEPAKSDAAPVGRRDQEPLLSAETDRSVASAFDALSATLAARSAELADGVIRELLRPMLKTWLDENLPGIVEGLVRAEIERVSRGSR